jgi:membrane associated rhomboid family serine protease
MILIILAMLVGAAITFAAVWPFGALIAIVATPFGASVSALIAGAFLAVLRSRQKNEYIISLSWHKQRKNK